MEERYGEVEVHLDRRRHNYPVDLLGPVENSRVIRLQESHVRSACNFLEAEGKREFLEEFFGIAKLQSPFRFPGPLLIRQAHFHVGHKPQAHVGLARQILHFPSNAGIGEARPGI